MANIFAAIQQGLRAGQRASRRANRRVAQRTVRSFTRSVQPTYHRAQQQRVRQAQHVARSGARQVKRVAHRQRHAKARPVDTFLMRRALEGGHGDFINPRSLWSGERRDLFGSAGSVERANYTDHYERLWKELHKEYPKGKMPKLVFEKAGRGRVLGFVQTVGRKPGDRDVHITPRGYYAAKLRPSDFERNSDSAQQGREVPIHEWVHAFQGADALYGKKHLVRTIDGRLVPARDGTNRSRRKRVEGGAQAFTYLIGPKVGIHYKHPKDWEYDRFARSILKRKGKGYVLRGQFR